LQFQISGERARCALRPAGCVIEELVDDDDDADDDVGGGGSINPVT